jgi:hypothetical protein
MRARVILLAVALLASVGVERVSAAIPTPYSTTKTHARMISDAKAAEPSPDRTAASTSAGLEADLRELLQRAMRERDNIWSARLDEIDARMYEVVGRLHLLAACLIGLLLALFVWLASVARQVARLSGQGRVDRSSGLG